MCVECSQRCFTFLDRGFVLKQINNYMNCFVPGDPKVKGSCVNICFIQKYEISVMNIVFSCISNRLCMSSSLSTCGLFPAMSILSLSIYPCHLAKEEFRGFKVSCVFYLHLLLVVSPD